jgi:hypothetical protein
VVRSGTTLFFAFSGNPVFTRDCCHEKGQGTFFGALHRIPSTLSCSLQERWSQRRGRGNLFTLRSVGFRVSRQRRENLPGKELSLLFISGLRTVTAPYPSASVAFAKIFEGGLQIDRTHGKHKRYE